VFAGSPLRIAATVAYLGLLAAAGVVDARERRIPNVIVGALLVCGLLFSLARTPYLPGVVRGMEGVLVGLVIWFPSYLLRLLGPGDVKLFAAASAWLGPLGAVEAAVLSALVGGLLALGWMLRFRGVGGTAASLVAARIDPRSLIRPEMPAERRQRLPYGVAMSVGCAIAGWHPHLLF
jgi:prepilin peptidase CpaA